MAALQIAISVPPLASGMGSVDKISRGRHLLGLDDRKMAIKSHLFSPETDRTLWSLTRSSVSFLPLGPCLRREEGERERGCFVKLELKARRRSSGWCSQHLAWTLTERTHGEAVTVLLVCYFHVLIVTCILFFYTQ